ncbi:Ser-Thr-rich glycosyl-phosphatidyl-inositol-anchored membrane family [Lasallia pustulata]|uniref:Ser-Thr-rich glycosyl-phosphatidyl-inositol-anchored membrane family n=1 Tax=Lasallia pustulata TaxID=136370 RepID=A0A1W5DCP2_9LECA|nr:Ser-Thr-rich glycosyl-phosphatidyl-inositol-anchored membrane family [Lasallia pustulata]
MRFSIPLLATSLFTLTSAQFSSNGPNAFKVPEGGYTSISAGTPVTLNWTPTTSGTVTLQLRSGNGEALDPGTTIASSIPNSGSYTFTPPASTIAGSDYTVEIISDTDNSAVNYTPQFAIASTNTVSLYCIDRFYYIDRFCCIDRFYSIDGIYRLNRLNCFIRKHCLDCFDRLNGVHGFERQRNEQHEHGQHGQHGERRIGDLIDECVGECVGECADLGAEFGCGDRAGGAGRDGGVGDGGGGGVVGGAKKGVGARGVHMYCMDKMGEEEY